jgi:hypothetical protein
MKRMNREQFFGKLTSLDEERLKNVLWTLYWRGSADLRAKIEAELDPVSGDRRAGPVKEAVDSQSVLGEVGDFVGLARAGAYMAGDRRVSPKERSRWRFTFQRLARESRDLLTVDADAGMSAVEQLVDLACETKGYDYFHSDDPMEAAGFVVSDAVSGLWAAARDRYGFTGFAERAAWQLFRWEEAYGWTRVGDGRVSEKERSLAEVMAQMLRGGDSWVDFADHYLQALDRSADDRGAAADHWRSPEWTRKERTRNLAAWHLMLLERLEHSDGEDRLDRLVEHRALAGPELTYLCAIRAKQRGEDAVAREHVRECLNELPGHQGFLDLAQAIGAPLPHRAQRIAQERSDTR